MFIHNPRTTTRIVPFFWLAAMSTTSRRLPSPGTSQLGEVVTGSSGGLCLLLQPLSHIQPTARSTPLHTRELLFAVLITPRYSERLSGTPSSLHVTTSRAWREYWVRTRGFFIFSLLFNIFFTSSSCIFICLFPFVLIMLLASVRSSAEAIDNRRT